jgi:hypothetical protein
VDTEGDCVLTETGRTDSADDGWLGLTSGAAGLSGGLVVFPPEAGGSWGGVVATGAGVVATGDGVDARLGLDVVAGAGVGLVLAGVAV